MEEDRRAGAHLGFGAAVQVELDGDPGFPRVALHARPPRRIRQFVRDAGPVPLAAELFGPELEAADAEVVGELQVGLTVADHRGVVKVDAAVAQVVLHQAEAWLARRRIVGGPAAVDQHLAEHDALALEHLQHEIVGTVEARARICLAAEAVLVADDHEFEPGIAQLQQRRDHAADETQLVVGVDLEVGRLLDQGAVAVDEEDFRGHQARTPAGTAAASIAGAGVGDGRRAASAAAVAWG